MTKQRNEAIDLLKGLLTVQMVLAHSLQFFVMLDKNPFIKELSEYINLTTFSGFVFAFGYAGYHAYFSQGYAAASSKILKNMLRLLVAFYISGFAFTIFREGASFSTKAVLDILLLNRLPGWSEFLFSFVCLMVLALLLFPILQHLSSKTALLLSFASLASCLLPYGSVHPIVGSFIGGTNGAFFSVVQYFAYFVAGVYFAANKIVLRRSYLAVAVGCSALFYGYRAALGFPSRFPASLLWVVGAAGFVYLYYLLSTRFVKSAVMRWLIPIGRQSLYYLVLSNILIFALRSARFYHMGVPGALIVFAVVMGCGGYLSSQTYRPSKTAKA